MSVSSLARPTPIELDSGWIISATPVDHPAEPLVVVHFTRTTVRIRFKPRREEQTSHVESFLMTATEHARMSVFIDPEEQLEFARNKGRQVARQQSPAGNGFAAMASDDDSNDPEVIKQRHLDNLDKLLKARGQADGITGSEGIILFEEPDFPETDENIQTADEVRAAELIKARFGKDGKIDPDRVFDELLSRKLENGQLPPDTGMPFVQTQTLIDASAFIPVRAQTVQTFSQFPIFDGKGEVKGTSLALQKESKHIVTPKKFVSIDVFMRVFSGFEREFFKKQVTKETAFGFQFALGPLAGAGATNRVQAGEPVFENGKPKEQDPGKGDPGKSDPAKGEKGDKNKTNEGKGADPATRSIGAAFIPPFAFDISFMSKKSRLIERNTLALLFESRLDEVVTTEIDL